MSDKTFANDKNIRLGHLIQSVILEIIRNSKIFDAVQLSKIRSNFENNVLKLTINTPITTSSWTIFRTYPIIFEREDKHLEIANVSEYLLIRGETEHLLISKVKFEKCYCPIERVHLCALNDGNSHRGSCETDVMCRHDLELCKTVQTNNRVRVVKIDSRTIYVTTICRM